MRKWRHLIGLLLCAFAIAVFELFAGFWSMADFIPGSDAIPEEITRQAEIGRAIFAPFKWGFSVSHWLKADSTILVPIVQFLLIPLLYGAILYALGYLIWIKTTRLLLKDKAAL